MTKQISLYGSVRLIDAASEEDIYNFVYNKLEEMVNAKIAESENQEIFVVRLKKNTINVINIKDKIFKGITNEKRSNIFTYSLGWFKKKTAK